MNWDEMQMLAWKELLDAVINNVIIGNPEVAFKKTLDIRNEMEKYLMNREKSVSEK